MAEAVRAYVVLAGAWTRAAAQYPVSMVLLGVSGALAAWLDAVAILLLFSRTDSLAGFGVDAVLFLYATTTLSFVVADAVFGNTERLWKHVRDGGLDIMLVRPVSPLVQIATEDFSPRRFFRLVLPTVLLVVVLPRLDVDWTAGRVLVIPTMVLSGIAIYAGIWVLTAAAQFVVMEVHGAAKTLTYGGGFLTQYPMSVYGTDFVRAFTFVVPLAFVNWQPALYVLDRPDPLGLPDAARLASPVVAVVICGVAAVSWRAGLRRYRSTGS